MTKQQRNTIVDALFLAAIGYETDARQYRVLGQDRLSETAQIKADEANAVRVLVETFKL